MYSFNNVLLTGGYGMDSDRYIAGYWKVSADLRNPLCSRFFDIIRRFDSAGIFVIPDTHEGKRNTDTNKKNVLFKLEGNAGESLEGVEALKLIISVIPQTRPFRWMLETAAGRSAADKAYLNMRRRKGCANCGEKRLR